MNIEQFAAITQRVIASDGFDEFLPTACYPARREVAALEGLPPGIEAEPAVLKWAAKKAKHGELHLVAFKSGPSQFTVVRAEGAKHESAVFEVADAEPNAAPDAGRTAPPGGP
jgi:hypothetical protein